MRFIYLDFITPHSFQVKCEHLFYLWHPLCISCGWYLAHISTAQALHRWQGIKISNLSEFIWTWQAVGTLLQTAPVWIGQLYLVHDLDCAQCTDMWQHDLVEMSLHLIQLYMALHNDAIAAAPLLVELHVAWACHVPYNSCNTTDQLIGEPQISSRI